MFRFQRSSNAASESRDQTVDGDYRLNGGRALQIFNADTTLNTTDSLHTWDSCDRYSLFLDNALPPKDYFEKMIYFTIEGKIWQFPIDNEQGKIYRQNIENIQ